MVSHKKKAGDISNESNKKETSAMSYSKKDANIGGKGEIKANGKSDKQRNTLLHG